MGVGTCSNGSRTWGWDVPPPGSSWKRWGGGFLGCRWRSRPEEGSPLLPLGPGPMEVDGTEQVPKDGTAWWGRATDEETMTPHWPTPAYPEWDGCGLACCLLGGVGFLLAGVWGWVDLCCGAKQTDRPLEVGLYPDLVLSCNQTQRAPRTRSYSMFCT